MLRSASENFMTPWLCAGDWNLPELHSPTLRTDQHGRTYSAHSRHAKRQWQGVFKHLLELSHGRSTRFCSATTRRGTTIVHSSLDRMYILVAPSEVPQYKFAYDVPLPALQGTAAADLSDHVPVKLTIHRRRNIPPSHKPIQGWVFAHPLFKKSVTQRLDKVDGLALHPCDLWRRTTQAIRCAAAATRNAALAARPKSGLALAQRAIQLARAVHRNDGKTAVDLRRRWPELREAISVRDGGTQVLDPPLLQRLLSDAIRAGSTLNADADGSAHEPDKLAPHRRALIASWLRLWVPHMRRRWLAGIVPQHDADTQPTADLADALAAH